MGVVDNAVQVDRTLQVPGNLGEIHDYLPPQIAKQFLGLAETRRQFLADDSHLSPRLPFSFHQPGYCLGNTPALAGPERVGVPGTVSFGVQATAAEFPKRANGAEIGENPLLVLAGFDDFRLTVVGIPLRWFSNNLKGKSEVVKQGFLNAANGSGFRVNELVLARLLHRQSGQSLARFSKNLVDGAEAVERSLGIAGNRFDNFLC